MKIDTNLFLSDFEAEARIHIEKIETAFLDISSFESDLKLMNSVFRAAHSLKGTAGFLSLEKIVAVTHELEGVLSQLKEEILTIDNEIADIVLQCVDCLKDLIENIQNDESIHINGIISTLKKYTNIINDNNEYNSNNISEKIHNPFNINDSKTAKALKNMSKQGHKIYYVNIGFNRSLGRYYKNPRGLIDSIISIGSILQAIVTDKERKLIENNDTASFIDELAKALKEQDTSTLEILVTSILEPDLFSIATGIDKKQIHFLSRETVFGDENNEKAKNPKTFSEDKKNNIISKTITENGKSSKQTSHGNNISIRLDISDINRLMDLANEMVLTRNQLFSVVAEHKKTILGLTPILHDMNHLTSEIHEKIMFTRMQPISVIFNKFPRIIRDIAKALDKDIAVNILRDEITLDKYLLEALADPITQLVKNAADHGMESAQERIDCGKQQKGTITLNSYMRDGSAIIEVIDDGRGIDIDALKNKAAERGIATNEILMTMTKNDVYNLIFKPGISTAKQVTNLSGRGVGMDIVKTNIEKSGGSIEIESEPGIGTTIRLKVPLTLSVINTLIVKIDSISYAIPELNIERIVRISGNTGSKRLEKVNKSLVLIYDGKIVPVITMNEIEAKAKNIKNQPVSADTLIKRYNNSGVTKCIVLKTDGKNFALLIDNALETEQILVKPLPIYLQNCPCYLSVTVLGNGMAVTILDAAGIMRFMGIEDIEKETAQKLLPAAKTDKKHNKTEKQIIIFKCSGTEYFAVETIDILRIESIKSKNIQEINNEYYINISGTTWRIVRPEDFAPVFRKDYTEEKLYVLTLKNSVSPIGLLVRNVIDKAEDEFDLDNKQIYSDFIFGTSVCNEKIIIFINPDAIIEHVENGKINNKNIKQGIIV